MSPSVYFGGDLLEGRFPANRARDSTSCVGSRLQGILPETTSAWQNTPELTAEVVYVGRSMKKDIPDESCGQRTPLSEDYLRAHTVGELKPLSCPIRIVDYDPEWPHQFECEENRIRSALGERASRIEHVGSTSVPGLPAKPVIDIVLVVSDSSKEAEYAAALDKAGYQLRIREADWYEHQMFKSPEKNVNLHVFSTGCRSRPHAGVSRLAAEQRKRSRVLCSVETGVSSAGVEVHSELR